MGSRSLSLFTATLFAGATALAGGGSATNSAAYAPNAPAETAGAPTPTTTAAPASEGTYNVNDGALTQGTKSSGSQSGGMMLGMAAAAVAGGFVAVNMPKCFQPKPDPGACVKMAMGIAGIGMSMAIVSQMQKARDASDRTADAVSLAQSKTAPRFEDSPAYSDLVKLKDQLAKNGYNLDLNTGNFTTPDGKLHTPADFSSPGAMAASGMSPSDIKMFGDMMNDISKKAASNAAGLDKEESGNADITVTTGGGAGASSGYGDSTLTGAQKIGIDRNPAQVAGLSKNLNGEPIGVAADSIFGMMNRRYDVVAKSCQVLVNKTCAASP